MYIVKGDNIVVMYWSWVAEFLMGCSCVQQMYRVKGSNNQGLDDA